MPAFLYHQPSGRFYSGPEAPNLGGIFNNFVDKNCSSARPAMVQHNGLALEFQTVPDAILSDQKAEKLS